jgi:tetratricopeptide (TPR) repeat protein
VPYLHSLIGKEAEKQALLELYQTVAASGKGMTVVLSGKPRSGRRALTQWLHQQVYLQGGAVAATRFWDTRLLPEEQTARLYWETPVMKSFGQRLAETYTQTSTALPHQEAWLNLVAQLTQQATSGAAISPDWPDTPLTLVRFVRQVARRQPLLLTVEYLDWADPIWIDLLRRMADEIAQDLPVLLVITLDAPAPLEQLPSEQHTESTRLAETLVVARQAREVYLGAVTPSDIAATLGPAVPALVEQLHALSAGDPFIVELLWEEWRAQQAVFQGWDGRWDINPKRAGEWWVFGDARDHARTLLERGLAHADPDLAPPLDVATVETLLACAALEGETFAAAIVAEVLGLDPDEVMDFFDDYLCCPANTESDDIGATRDCLLVEAGFAALPNGNTLCRYRFARPYLWHVFGKYPQAQQERQVWSEALAETLEACYAPDTYLVADTLCRLFDSAGRYDRARAYRRQPLSHPRLEHLRYHVRFLRETTGDDDTFGAYRLLGEGFALLRRLVNEAPDWWEEGLELAEDLARRAAWVGDRAFQAEAYHDQGWCLQIGGRFAEALPRAQRAVRIFEECHGLNSEAVARGLSLLGSVLRAQGDLPAARAAFERALRILEATLGPDHPNVATDVNNLGLVLQDLGDLPAARAAYERALRSDEATFGPDHPNVATDVNNLGSVLRAQGDLLTSRAAFERALRIFERALPPGHPNIAIARRGLEIVEQELASGQSLKTADKSWKQKG